MLRINGIRAMLAAAAVFCCAVAASADVKVKTRNSFGSQSSESTVYIKGKRQRMESQGGMANITQCDLRRTLSLNGMTKTYTVSAWDEGNDNKGGEATAATAAPAQPSRRGGLVTTTVTTTDTGERKQMFGYTARRIKSSMVTESSPDACSPVKSRMDTDGWYIDLAVEFDCGDRAGGHYASANQGGCRDEHRMKQVGSARLGYPVQVTTTMYDETGKPTYTMTQEVLEISKATLDAALFDVPSDYRQVNDASEMYSAASIASAAGQSSTGSSSSASSSSAAMGGMDVTGNSGGTNSGGMSVNAPSTTGALATGPKQPGTVRVGVVATRATAAEGMDSNTLAEAVRNTMINHLRGPAVEIVALDARVPMQIEAEARQKECDYIVYTTVTHKKGGGGGGFGGFMKKAAPVMGSMPLGGMAGSAGGAAAAHATTTAVYTAAHVAGSVKSKDELTLEYTLQKNGSAVASNKLKAKASSDGEDLITRLVEQAATAVLTQAAAK